MFKDNWIEFDSVSIPPHCIEMHQYCEDGINYCILNHLDNKWFIYKFGDNPMKRELNQSEVDALLVINSLS